jgi:hypothetical protein
MQSNHMEYVIEQFDGDAASSENSGAGLNTGDDA